MSFATRCFRVEFIEAGGESGDERVDYVLADDVREAAGIIQNNYNVDRIIEVVEVSPAEMDGHSDYSDGEEDDGWTDVEADADTLRNVGWGTDEDYGYYGGEYD